ncbi:MAG: IS21 family transposase [Planctomycetota bacterium]
MVTDGQVSELRRWLANGKSLAAAARMASMDKKTARWNEIEQMLQAEPRLRAKTLFDDLQRRYPGCFDDSTRRTFERRVAKWRAINGPDKPVFFPQDHHPGKFAASDFTVCNSLGVRIAGQVFKHTLFHCVLTYSNFESVSLCFSESFEALSEGIQNAFWQFGGVPAQHRTDSLSAAVRNHSDRRALTTRYAALMEHYRCKAQKTNARCANENGDVESQNGHLKSRIEQALLLRGSRDFPSRDQYMEFVQEIVDHANAGRSKRFAEEQPSLGALPDHRLDTDDVLKDIRVSKRSTINVRANTYSVPSRLIGMKVDVRVAAETITVMHGGTVVQTMNRLVGKQAASINYRNVIDSKSWRESSPGS